MKRRPPELDDLLDRSSAAIAAELGALAVAQRRGDERQAQHHAYRAGSLTVGSMAIADLLGRAGVKRQVDAHAAYAAAPPPDAPAPLDDAVPIMPRVPYLEAVEDILERYGLVETDWQEVARVYTQRRAFAMARSLRQEVTDAVQRYIGRALRDGVPLAQAEEQIADIGGWTTAYAGTVFRTNVASAHQAGRWVAATDPSAAGFVGGLRYVTAGDRDVRPNHRMLDGIVAAVNDPIWERIAPPRGYNCRCDVELVFEPVTKRAQIPAGWQADPGFGHVVSPSVRFYGATAQL